MLDLFRAIWPLNRVTKKRKRDKGKAAQRHDYPRTLRQLDVRPARHVIKELKVAVIGVRGVGKSSLILRVRYCEQF
jgi:GTPase SAR1 family protein